MSHTNWWAHACLCLASVHKATSPIKIAEGTLVELVTAALQMPEDQQPNLYIKLDGTSRRLWWASIVSLSQRSDLPVLI